MADNFFQTGKVSCLFIGGMKFPKTFSCTGCGSKPRLLGMLGMTASFMLVELIVGNLTNSMALVADSFHMLSDVIALVREVAVPYSKVLCRLLPMSASQ